MMKKNDSSTLKRDTLVEIYVRFETIPVRSIVWSNDFIHFKTGKQSIYYVRYHELYLSLTRNPMRKSGKVCLLY